ncbi:hypothetical protein GW932_03450 [archaeon]|nr:hypothetical protein [archaeon]
MKKRSLILSLIFVLSFFSLANVLAVGCDIQVSLVNQDPLPAIPGESAKLIFQIDGIENVECGTVEFELLENYPITLEPGQKSKYSIESGTYTKNYQSFFLAPFKVIIDKDAIDGNFPLEVRYRFGTNTGYETKDVDLEVEDVRADFEIYVKDYDVTTRTLTFEILNIDDSDVEALTLEIPKQDGITVRGSNKNIVGDLDSNEYTTADFDASPTDGKIKVLISYSDSINVRRTIEKEVVYDSTYFEGVEKTEKKPVVTYVIVILVIGLLAYLIYRRNKKKKAFQAKLRK